MSYHVGVDLGTTFTAAAVARDGTVEPVSLGGRGTAIPSVLYLDTEGLLVGDAAVGRAADDPSRVAREFKRRVGDSTPLLLGGTPVAADALMARLLQWTVDHLEGGQGGPPAGLAVTHPANWGEFKLDLLSQAVRHVGLDVDHLVPEPVAAAAFYAGQRDIPRGTSVAVYDLGGGTFDAAVVRADPDGFRIVGQPDGIERLGGIDFDQAVLRHVVDLVGLDVDALDPDDPVAMAAFAQLRQECATAKEALSTHTDATISVTLPGLHSQIRITRSEFETMIRPAIDETLVCLQRTITSADQGPDELRAVLLVGGSSRIPLVAQLVTAELRLPIAVDARPKDAICMGAALFADAAAGARPAPAPVPPPPPAAYPRRPLTPDAATPEAPPLGPSRPTPGRRSPVAVAAALLMAVAAAGAGFLLIRDDPGGSGDGGDDGTAGGEPPAAGELTAVSSGSCLPDEPGDGVVIDDCGYSNLPGPYDGTYHGTFAFVAHNTGDDAIEGLAFDIEMRSSDAGVLSSFSVQLATLPAGERTAFGGTSAEVLDQPIETIDIVRAEGDCWSHEDCTQPTGLAEAANIVTTVETLDPDETGASGYTDGLVTTFTVDSEYPGVVELREAPAVVVFHNADDEIVGAHAANVPLNPQGPTEGRVPGLGVVDFDPRRTQVHIHPVARVL